MTKILNFALKIKRGGREGGTCEVLRPCHPPLEKKLKRAPDPRLEWPEEGPLFQLDLKKYRGKMWTLFESPLGPLFMSGMGPLAR